MANKIIAIVDINNDLNQNIETLLVANILEKKCSKLTVIDLNLYNKSFAFFDLKDCKEKDEILTLKLFDRSNYIFPSNEAYIGSKMIDLVKSLEHKSDILIINPNQTKFDFNTSYYELATNLVVFADIKQDINTKLVNLFLKHNLSSKSVHIYVYNYENNMQDQKTYLSLIKRFQSKNIVIDTVNEISKYNSIDKVSNIDPWEDIYKKINGAF